MEHKFIYKNFKPNPEVLAFCCQRFHQIWGNSPSDSSVSAEVSLDGKKSYNTVIEILASTGRFKAEASDVEVEKSVSAAVDKIKDLLKEWKRSGVSTQEDGITPIE